MRARAGVVLLEVLLATTILALGAVGFSTLIAQSVHAVTLARARGEEIRRASAFLAAVALWPRDDLDRRLGSRPQGEWRLEITRTLPLLYSVTLTDSSRGRAVLRTALFRPDSVHVAR